MHQKILHLHHDFFYFPRNFTYYKMKPSKKYKNELFSWRNEENQIKLMIEDKCIYNFTVLEPNIF